MSDRDNSPGTSRSTWEQVRDQFHLLAELESEEQERRLVKLAEEDAGVAAEVRALLSADRQSSQVPDRIELAGEEPPLVAGATVGPYRVLAELGRGGMGIVYRGERADGAFERQVAIKVALPELVSPALGLRFAEERRILATLDHPGIAGLLDAGTTDDGGLFLVLDLVEGERLDIWARTQPLQARLELFVAICDAVDHAHRNLVLHRDLKPANILVTDRGQPKLLDFGIARLLAEDGAGQGTAATAAMGEATRLGFRPLTPEYASPEQLRGEPLSTAADVFALGVLLCEIVSGSRPYEMSPPTSPEERARRIEAMPPPRTPGVARDLDAIIGQALAPLAADRYPSAAALGTELRAFLDGRPITARPATLADRAGKFVRRHRLAVAVAGAFVAVLLGATAFSLRQAAIATREKELAERRFVDLRALANSLLFEIHGAVRDLNGATQARELIVRRALEYLERLAPLSATAANAGLDPGLSREVAAGYEEVAEIQGALVQGSSLGQVTTAQATIGRALFLREALAGRAEALWEDRLAYATTLDKAAALALGSGRYAEALPLAERQVAWARQLNGERPSDIGALDALAAASERMGAVRSTLASDEGQQLLGAAVELRRRLLAAEPTSADRRGDLARSLRLLAGRSLMADQEKEAEEQLREAVEIQEALLAQSPESVRARSELTKSLINLGSVLSAGRPREAILPLSRAGELATAAGEADPANVNLVSLRMSIEGELAVAYIELGEFATALAHQQRHVALVEELAAGNEVPERLALYSMGSYRWLGEIHGRLAAAAGDDSASRRRHLLAARSAYLEAKARARGRIDSLAAEDPYRLYHAELLELLADSEREILATR